MQSVLNSQLDKIGQQQQAQLEAATCRAAHEEAAAEAALGNSKAAPDATCDLCCCSTSTAPAGEAGCCTALECACRSDSLSSIEFCDSIRRTDSEQMEPAAAPAAATRCTRNVGIAEALPKAEPAACGVSMEIEAACCESSCDRDQPSAMQCEDSSKLLGTSSSASLTLSDHGTSVEQCGEQCCVCWEEELSVGIAPCSHALCYNCARQLVVNSGSTGATCPLCRRFIAGFELLETAGCSKLKLVSGAGI